MLPASARFYRRRAVCPRFWITPVRCSAAVTGKRISGIGRKPPTTKNNNANVSAQRSRGKISTITATFNKLLVSKGREATLPEIINAFIKQYKEFKNIHTVKLTTASPLSEELKNAIVGRVKATSEMQNIELETIVDEKLIGGFTLQAGDKLIDASIAYDLREIAKQFDNNDFIYKVR